MFVLRVLIGFLVFWSATVAADLRPGLPEGIPGDVAAYLESLDHGREVVVSAGDRVFLLGAARVLSKIGECASARGARRPLLLAKAGHQDWLAQAEDAVCANGLQEALGASHQAYVTAANDAERVLALRVMARAAERHSRYDAGDVLQIYQLAQTHGRHPEVERAVARLEAEKRAANELRLQRIEVLTNTDEPSICLHFNQELAPLRERSYTDFVITEPRAAVRFRLGGTRELCLDGGEFGREYRVSVLEGLTDAEGRPLRSTRRERVRVGDRSPGLRFQNHLYVLPRNAVGVPVNAVNVEEVRLVLHRIDERNLVHSRVRNLFGRDLELWNRDQIENELGTMVWEGEARLPGERNRETQFLLPLAERIEGRPGVYVLTAEVPGADHSRHWVRASQWLVVSDLGISTYQGRDGFTVGVRGLGDARPRAAVRVEVLARNNSRLAAALTDASGLATLPVKEVAGRGGQEPVMLLAFSDDGDFNFLDISRSPFDLSDRGVVGRAHSGPLDAFLYTERGAYRPGERVNLGVLVRDDRGDAAPELPLTLRLRRPDDSVALERVLSLQEAGGGHLEFRIPDQGRTGRWQILAYADPEADPIGQAEFQVQAILPPRIEVRFVDADEAPLAADRVSTMKLQADYLFGAPASDLEVRSELRVRTDAHAFPAWPGFRFGPLDVADDRVLLPLEAVRTGADGSAQVSVILDRMPATRLPLRAELRSDVIDVDGRVVSAVLERPVDTGAGYVGVRLVSANGPEGAGSIESGDRARFEVVAVDELGKPVSATGIEYRLLREHTRFRWYREHGQWLYRREVTESGHAHGALELTSGERGRLEFSLDSGRYRLDVRDPATNALASARVQVGWGGGQRIDDTPDRLRVTRDRPVYAPGATAQIAVESPFDGPGQVVIATDRVLKTATIEVRQGRASLDLAIDPDWGAGAYALVTVFRPDDSASGLGPRRAIGLTYLGMDHGDRKLQLELESPERLRPLETMEVGIRVADFLPGEHVFVTLAAVDEGLLQLTAHPDPRPLDHFFAQRRLGLDLRDLYGRLLDGRLGQPGRIGTGAGAAGPDPGIEPPVILLSLHSGVVALDAQGRARVRFELPEFEGRVRLHAVAWSGQRLGHAQQAVTVRDPVVVQAALPRFLRTGDGARATVSLFNAEAPAGSYRLHWEAGGALVADSGVREFDLSSAARHVEPLQLAAAETGHGRLELLLEGPGGLSLRRSLRVGVQPAYALENRRETGALNPGAVAVLGGSNAADLLPDTITSDLVIDTQPQWDVPGLVRQLDLYPYGCLEQVTSRAFPLLDLPRLAELYRLAEPEPQRLSDAVQRILDLQLDTGGFTLWGGPNPESGWASVYALDFLGEARRQGIVVPDFAWERGLLWLAAQTEFPESRDPQRLAVQSYALYVLARHGQGRAETARYLLDRLGDQLPGSLVAAQLGAALALAGDRERAIRAFRLAESLDRRTDLGDYGSALRDRAELLRLANQYAPGVIEPAGLVLDLAERFAGESWLSTQEQASLLRAAAAVSADGREVTLQLGGLRIHEARGPVVLSPPHENLVRGLNLGNHGRDTLWYSLLLSGHPTAEPAEVSRGLRIRRSFHDLTGNRLEERTIEQGAVLVVVIEGEALEADQAHQLLIVDPLAAGIEVDVPGLEGSRALHSLSWLDDLSPTLYTDALDDRFIAALDLDGAARGFRVAYLARAVAPGTYRLGPVFVEDMYRPRFHARADAGVLEVHPRE